ncbi:MAG TPA: aspartate-semialdehyde dehydrogenase [bacterium]|nr:aspartate-semialdehyde dehydrogenase [bacterium]HNS47963.1 aspartate-semialdehyde dehydrogenase [bacterium]
MKGFQVGVVGASGAVGRRMVSILESRRFPVGRLRLFASERSAGQRLEFAGEPVEIERLTPESFTPDIDLLLFSAGASVSREYAPRAAALGIFVVDNSSAWRMEPGIPLVVPEVNPEALSPESLIIANPNCSTIQMVCALYPLHRAARLRRVVVSTYQAVSGAGQKAIREMEDQLESLRGGREVKPAVFPHQIAFNLIPQIDLFLDNGYTKEEMKMVNETRKIMGEPSLPVTATCVRVPVLVAHSEAVTVDLEKPLEAGAAREILARAPGVEVIDAPEAGRYPMPLMAAGRDAVYVGRIRRDLSSPNGLSFWVVSDNLRKGAALNAVQIAECLFQKGFLSSRRGGH